MRKLTFAFLLPLFAPSAFASCDLAGTYVRLQQGLPPSTLELSPAAGGLRFGLDAYGPKMYDGNPTAGTLEGLATPGRGSACTALFTSAEDECSVRMTRTRAGVKLVQVGSCLTFGAGVDASGLYRKKENP